MSLFSRVKRYSCRFSKNLHFVTDHPLTRRNRLAALRRYLLFHSFGRIGRSQTLFPWIGGIRYFARPGAAGIVGNIYTGLEDFEEMAFLLHLLREDDLFVDVGANVGAYTLLASGVRRARSIAIEPIASSCEALLLNLRVNDLLDRVEIHAIGAGASDGRLFFSNQSDVLNRVVLDPAGRDDVVAVDVRPLDGIIGDRLPTMVKIDVEGWESEVLRGASKVLRSERLAAVIIETRGHGNRYGFSDSDAHGLLSEAGFEPCAYDPTTRVAARIGGSNQDRPNAVYLRDFDFVRDRLSRSPKFVVLGQEFQVARPDGFPMATREWLRLVSLPIFPDMTEEEQAEVVTVVKELCARYRR